MAATLSTMLELGTLAPPFSLPDAYKNTFSLTGVAGARGTLVMFICNHCPFVIHIIDELSSLAKHYSELGISCVAISSNDIANYPQDGPEFMKEFAIKYGIDFPYLYDESQQVAKSYQAACTPDFFLYDDQLKLVYRGQFDDSRPGNGVPVTGKDVKDALDALLNGTPVSKEQKPSIGCNIKWVSGNEPEYYG